MIPSGYVSGWQCGGGSAAGGGQIPYSEIMRRYCTTYDGLALLNCSEQPTMSGGTGDADNESGSAFTVSWSGAPTFGAAGSNGYGITVAITDSLASDGLSTTIGQTGSWVVTFLPTAWPTGTDLAAIAGLIVFTHPSTYANDRVLYFDNAGTLYFTLQNSGSTYTTISSSAGALTLDLWHEIIVIWTTSHVYLYIDQTLVASTSLTPLNITGGGSDSVSYFLGDASHGSAYVGVAGTYDMAAYFGEPLPNADEGTGTSGAADYSIFVGGLTTGIGVSHSVSATSAITISPSCTGLDGKNWVVSASSAVTVAPTCLMVTLNHTYTVSADSSMILGSSGTASVHSPAIYTVSAATAFSVSSHGNITLARVHSVSALSAVSIRSFAYVPRIIEVSAANIIYMEGLASCDNSTHYASATTSFNLSDSNVFSKFGPVYVSASTSFILHDFGSETHPGPRYVSAASGFSISDFGSETNPGPRYVSAATSVDFSQATIVSHPGPRPVSATSGILVSGAGSENRDGVVAASTGFVLSTAGSEVRDIGVSASTSFATGPAVQTSNLKPEAATSSFVLHASATHVVTGTEAASGITLLGVAFATVQLPWRRANLTLPDGGNIPHS